MAKGDKDPTGEPSDAAAAHNVPDPHDAEPQNGPQNPQSGFSVPENQKPQPVTPANREPVKEVRYSSAGARNVMRRGMNQPGCWVQGGTLEPFASVMWALSDLAELRGVSTNPSTNEVDKVLAARVGIDSKVWIHPTDPENPEGTLITRTKDGSVRINLYKFLARENLLIAVRRRERFNMEVVTDSRSPVGPALCIDFTKPLETKVIPPRKKKDDQEKSGGKTGGKSKKDPERKAPPPDIDADDEEE
jgi:hypothetical protein